MCVFYASIYVMLVSLKPMCSYDPLDKWGGFGIIYLFFKCDSYDSTCKSRAWCLVYNKSVYITLE